MDLERLKDKTMPLQNLKTNTLSLGLQLVWAPLRSPERNTRQKQGALL